MTEARDPHYSDVPALRERLNAADLPNLASFLAGYLHGDWRRQFASPAEAAFAFAGAADLDDVAELAEEWGVLVSATRELTLGEINRLLRERFHSGWEIVAKTELEAVAQELERALRE